MPGFLTFQWHSFWGYDHIDQSFACRVGKGTHAASDYLSAMLRSAHSVYGKVFVLKADISKYFYSIDHDILLRVIGRIIGDKYVLEILRRLVKECGCIEGNRGLPLGTLTSQLMANAYYIKEQHMVTSTTQSGILVDYSAYIWAWGKTPRGNGNWAFYLGDETEPRFYQGFFAQTKKQAVNDAKAAGYWRVKVSS